MPLLPEADPNRSKGFGNDQAHRTRLSHNEQEKDFNDTRKGDGTDDPDRIKYHYWKMIQEHGGDVTADDEVLSVTTTQLGVNTSAHYDYVTCPNC